MTQSQSEKEIEMTQQEKLVFASPEWVELGRKVLEELVAKHGEEGQKFSIC